MLLSINCKTPYLSRGGGTGAETVEGALLSLGIREELDEIIKTTCRFDSYPEFDTDEEFREYLWSVYTEMNNLEIKKLCVRMAVDNSTTGGLTLGLWFLEIHRSSANWGEIIAHTTDFEAKIGVKNGTLDMWKWSSCPMISGVEYCTTEMHQNKPVYTKLVSLGTLPAKNNHIHIGHGLSGVTFIRSSCYCSDGSSVPYGYQSNLYLIDYSVSTTSINVFTYDNDYSDYSSKTGYCQLWYIW